MLEPADRDIFYTLEDYELLSTERETLNLYDGREWRIHYWVLNSEKILSSEKTTKEMDKTRDEDYSVYDEMPEDAWAR